MADAFLVTLFRHKAWCNEGLVAALKAAPADVDKMKMAVVLFTFGHTHVVDRIFRAHLMGVPHDFSSSVPVQYPDLDALGAAMRETDAWYIDYAGRVSKDELESTVDVTFVDDSTRTRMTRGEILAHIITHGASHRGQIGQMLGEMKVKGTSDMVTTFHGENQRAAARE